MRSRMQKPQNSSLMRMLAAGLLLRIIALGTWTQDMWHDAAFSVLFSKMPLSYIMTGHDVHPFLYYFALKLWMLVSDSEIWVRALSIVFWVLFMIYFWKYANTFLSKSVANLTAILLAFSPTMVIYSLEPRNYMLGMFLVMAQFYYFSLMFRGEASAKNKWLLILFTVLMFWTHYFTILILLPEFLYLLFDRKLNEDWAHVAGWAFLGWLPIIALNLIPSILQIEGFWFKDIGIISVLSSFVYQFIQTDSAGLAVSLLLLGAMFFSILMTKHDENPTWTLFVYPVLLMALISQFHPMYHHRFFLFFAFGLYISFVQGISNLMQARVPVWGHRNMFKVLGTMFYFIILLVFIVELFHVPERLPTEIADAQARLKQVIQPGDIIMHETPFSYTPLRYYFRGMPVEQVLLTNLSERVLYTAGGAVLRHDDIYSSLAEVQRFAGDRTIYYVGGEGIYGNTIFEEGGLYVQKIK